MQPGGDAQHLRLPQEATALQPHAAQQVAILTAFDHPSHPGRSVALICSWCFTLTVASYAYFALEFLGYGQQQISLTASAGALVGVGTQLLLLPRLVGLLGEHRSLLSGLVVLGACFGGAALVRLQPWHAVHIPLASVGAYTPPSPNVQWQVRLQPWHAVLFLAARAGLAAWTTRRLGRGVSGHHGLHRLHLKASGRPRFS